MSILDRIKALLGVKAALEPEPQGGDETPDPQPAPDHEMARWRAEQNWARRKYAASMNMTPTRKASEDDDGFDGAGFAIGYGTGVPIGPRGVTGGAILGSALHTSNVAAYDYTPNESRHDSSPSSSSSYDSGSSNSYSSGSDSSSSSSGGGDF